MIKAVLQATTNDVVRYYRTRESRWGYRWLLRGVKHFGYYPEGSERISMRQAQSLMEEQLAEAVNLPLGSLVFDAGCGEGKVAKHLASERGWKIHGIDLLDFNIASANSKPEQEIETEFTVGDYTHTEFPDNTFDAVYTMETLVHAADYQKALAEFRRVLKPGGKLVMFEYTIVAPAELSGKEREEWDAARKAVIEGSAMHSLPEFIHGSFPGILSKAGFSDVTVRDITERTYPMLRRFRQLAVVPYQLVKLFGKQRQYANITAGAIMHRGNRKRDLWRYVIVTGHKLNS